MAARDDIPEDALDEIRDIFAHFDHDDNGVIDRQEFGALMRALDESVSDSEIADGLAILDDNRNGVIDFDEFLEWWAERNY